MPAAKIIRILFLEDSPQDMELEERELRKGGLVFESRCVQTRGEFEGALRDFDPDIVISDYTLPNLDGLTALEVSKEIRPSTPFLFVSGTIGEERAIDILKRGATDYVAKSQLRGLCPKVKRALKEARERTRRKALESELRQAQKLEAIGRLAGGVAHDFNNLLTAINGYSQILLSGLPEDGQGRNELEEILKAGERAAALTRQLLAFSRKQILQPRVLEVNEVVAGIEKMLRRIIGEDIEMLIEKARGPLRVKTDPSQLEQVILNLVVNARDAMPKGGVLTIKTGRVELRDTDTNVHTDISPGSYVFFEVADTGAGISKDVLPHIFEPFFTTKGEGRGTGLGLSTVFGIVRQTDGRITVRSRLGQGSTFRILLPSVDAPVDQRTPAPAVPRTLRGTETVLVVEDDPSVRNLIREVLDRNGYSVLEAGSGDEALKRCEGLSSPVDLLVSDVVMPRMSGFDLADKLSRVWPGIRTLFVSGYSDSGVLRRGSSKGAVTFLSKPFEPEALLRKVRETLETERT